MKHHLSTTSLPIKMSDFFNTKCLSKILNQIFALYKSGKPPFYNNLRDEVSQ